MGDSNQRTLQTYDGHIQAYVDGTAHQVAGPSRDWIERALDGLPATARILELGSAFGRDAAYVQGRGFTVECTDASHGFLDHLRAAGFSARPFNALTDVLAPEYDLILANAVLLHFSRDEFSGVLTRMAAGLRPGGRFAFSLKRGDGEGWSSQKLNAPRYFCYWQPEHLPAALVRAGFGQWDVVAANTGRQHADWLYVIARI